MTYTMGLMIFAIIAGIIMGIFNIPFWILVVTILSLGLIRLIYIFYVLYYVQNIKRVQSYLTSIKRHTLYAYALTLPKGTKSEQIQAIDKILAKYKSPLMQATYRTNRALLNKDYEEAKKAVEPIQDKPLGQFSLALIYALQEDKEHAHSFNLAKPWMKPLIEAVLSYKEGHINDFERCRDVALQHSRGIQYYSNYYFFERIDEQ